VKEDD